ncbi:MAG: alpha/beta fold hydrolase [Gemmatimonadota bacterium]|nr:alpha/beta fold hydrolase [Gemmatimonadota bacterium]
MNDTQGANAAHILPGAETIDLQEEDSHGVLLLHGFGDTPQTLGLLARRLRKSGYSVLAPLLPGHGRSMESFGKSRARDWIAAAKDAYVEMLDRHDDVSVVGLSMGGALSVLLAGEDHGIPALILIAPYLGMPKLLRLAAATHWLWGRLAGEVNARSPRSIHDPIEREKNLAYGAVTGRQLHELSSVVRRARKALPNVRVPTLIIQSRQDPRCPPSVAEFALSALASTEKKLVWTEGAGHIITVDYGRERVFSEVERWLEAHSNNGSAAAMRNRAAAERPRS